MSNMNDRVIKKGKKIIIAVAGPKGSGKTSLCNNLKKYYGGDVHSFASELKDIVQKAFELPSAYIYGDKKEDSLPSRIKGEIPMTSKYYRRILIDMERRLKSIGLIDFDWRKIAVNLYGNPVFTSGRNILQWVGTNLMHKVYKDFHCVMLNSKFKNPGIYYIDDLRFESEHEYLINNAPGNYEYYSMVIRGRNEVEDDKIEHISEAEWRRCSNIEVVNNDTIVKFYDRGKKFFNAFADNALNDVDFPSFEEKTNEKKSEESKKDEKKKDSDKSKETSVITAPSAGGEDVSNDEEKSIEKDNGIQNKNDEKKGWKSVLGRLTKD